MYFASASGCMCGCVCRCMCVLCVCCMCIYTSSILLAHFYMRVFASASLCTSMFVALVENSSKYAAMVEASATCVGADADAGNVDGEDEEVKEAGILDFVVAMVSKFLFVPTFPSSPTSPPVAASRQ